MLQLLEKHVTEKRDPRGTPAVTALACSPSLTPGACLQTYIFRFTPRIRFDCTNEIKNWMSCREEKETLLSSGVQQPVHSKGVNSYEPSSLPRGSEQHQVTRQREGRLHGTWDDFQTKRPGPGRKNKGSDSSNLHCNTSDKPRPVTWAPDAQDERRKQKCVRIPSSETQCP